MRIGRFSTGSNVIVALVVAGACAVTGTLPGAVTSAAGEATASSSEAGEAAKRKRCGRGQARVRRRGRSSVCAKKCRRGFKHKVSRRGKVSCVRKGWPPSPPATTPPPASNGPAAGTYRGTTAQGRPVTFTFSGGQVTNFAAGVNTYCTTQGNQRTVFDAIASIPPMAIGPGVTFSYTGPPQSGNAQIRGRIAGNSATGTVGMFRGETNFEGGQLYFGNCSASNISWSASPG